jgi:hypothetical protein
MGAAQAALALVLTLVLALASIGVRGASVPIARASALDGVSDQNLARWAGTGLDGARVVSSFPALLDGTWFQGGPAHLGLARYVLPWDVMADTSDQRLGYRGFLSWYQRVLELGLVPDLALSAGEPGSYGGVALGALPGSSGQYEHYVAALLRSFGAVRYLEAWNEPNAQRLSPATAASYWSAAARACRRAPAACTTIAGDLLDSDPEMIAYERAYESALPADDEPTQWAIHPYFAVNHYADARLPYPPASATTVAGFEHALPQPSSDSVWFTEIGAYYCEVPSPGSGEPGVQFGEQIQRRAASYLVDTLIPDTRPSHVFYYQLAYGFGLQTPCAEPDQLGRSYTDSALYAPSASPGPSAPPGPSASPGPERPRAAASVILAAARQPQYGESQLLREPFWGDGEWPSTGSEYAASP